MSQPSLVIRNAHIVDGTGGPSIYGDVAIRDGRISEVGTVSGKGAHEIDADDLTLAPGFIDVHTHYDPQLCWDRLATPSMEHGVTTVVTGNCSLSLAPVKPDGSSRKLVKMFEKIEDISEHTFEQAVPFNWESFPEYLEEMRKGLGINVGFLVGHSALRWYVMGAESQQRVATDGEIARMCELLEQAMEAGALGMSISYVDLDEHNKPVPSQLADMREKTALCKAMAKSGRGVLQTVPIFFSPKKQLENIAELGELSLASGIMCTFAPLLVFPVGGLWKKSLDALEAWRAKGAKVFAQVTPRPFDFNMRLSEHSMIFIAQGDWERILKLPIPERIAALKDPINREKLRIQSAKIPTLMALTVGEVYSAENEPLRGRKLMELSGELGKHLADTLIDIALADDLRTEFRVEGVMHADTRKVGDLLDHPLCHVGASDAGAHVAQFCGAGDTTFLLEKYVRDEDQLSLERAVHRITGELADDWGIKDRGRIAPGLAADLVLFDPDEVARLAL